ncbi:MAG TPA: DUF4342 domain-containing protein [Herpetosiphonaceae bacterium]
MQPAFTRETLTIEGRQLLAQIKDLVHEGNVRRIIIKQDERVIVEFPLTVGVVGAVVAPVLAGVAVIAALLAECTIEVEREEPAPPAPAADTIPLSVEAPEDPAR